MILFQRLGVTLKRWLSVGFPPKVWRVPAESRLGAGWGAPRWRCGRDARDQEDVTLATDGAKQLPSRAQPREAPGKLTLVVCGTGFVLGTPVALLAILERAGLIASPAATFAVSCACSLAVAALGCAVWKRLPWSTDLLFNELLPWGFLRRIYNERKIADLLRPAEREDPEAAAKTLEKLARKLDRRDPLTHGHSQRVARHAWMIAVRMGLPEAEVARIRVAAAVHDVGK